MADTSNSSSSPTRRRSSFVDMFSSRPNMNTSNSTPTTSASTGAVPTMPASSEQPQPSRRASVAESLGLTSASGSTSAYGAFARQRRASVATSSASGSPEFRNSFSDDNAVIEEDDTLGAGPPSASTSFGRRLSFGAQALKDVKQGSTVGSPPGGGRRPSTLYTLNENNERVGSGRQSSPNMAKTGEGFSWSDSLRDRSKRTPSFASGNPFGGNAMRARSSSNTQQEPPKQMPKPVEPVTPTRMKKPDHLGERMLRGDFMMD